MPKSDQTEFIELAKKSFREEFGRAPSGNDRLISAGYLHSSDDLNEAFISGALHANIPGQLVYATRVTGVLLSKENEHLVDPRAREAFYSAVEAYFLASEHGVDLNEVRSVTEEKIADAKRLIEICLIHLGSYCVRAPRKTKVDQPLFFKFLLIAQCFQALKSVKDRFGVSRDAEILRSLRQIYECALILASMENDPTYSSALIAQSLGGTEQFPYRIRRDGRPDYSKIVDTATGDEFPSRTSFGERASKISHNDKEIFDILYPDLSSGVHYDSLISISRYIENNSFLDFGRKSLENQIVRILAIAYYLLKNISNISDCPKSIKRDVRFLKNKLTLFMDELAFCFDLDEVTVDRISQLLIELIQSDFKISK